ncbi:hypothetical protein TNCV_4400341 [Trichonephila clavipes]|nr:hypothetical protein TNCV_4400341 [Trichonephila clavipes]
MSDISSIDRETTRKRFCPEFSFGEGLRKTGNEKLDLGNAPLPVGLPGWHLLVFKGITVLKHPPYSQGLTPCDFYVFLKVKSSWK